MEICNNPQKISNLYEQSSNLCWSYFSKWKGKNHSAQMKALHMWKSTFKISKLSTTRPDKFKVLLEVHMHTNNFYVSPRLNVMMLKLQIVFALVCTVAEVIFHVLKLLSTWSSSN